VIPLNFDVRVIDHKSQRYSTLGDYFVDGEGLHFRISDLGDWRMEGLVVVHELVEYLLIRAAGLNISDIDTFDMTYPPGGEHEDDPGNDPASPYHLQHLFAEAIERTVCDRLGLDWNAYSDRIDSVANENPASP
jgi:hypothetical protein